MKRSLLQTSIDFITFPIRGFLIFEEDKWGLTSLRNERFYYVCKFVSGYTLDVGCGRNNVFVNVFLKGNGRGIDVYPYEGLTEDNVVEDITHFPFKVEEFDTVTFIANLNHVPESMRDIELLESYRVLKPGGKIIVTMGNPLAEILVHRVVALHDRIAGTSHDMDGERGMNEEEVEYLRDSEIIQRLKKAGFRNIARKYFITQWGLNHLLFGWKVDE